MTETGEQERKVAHPFARAGMGVGPWRFVGVAQIPPTSLGEANPDAYNNALRDLPKLKAGLGTCACCGMAIMNIFIVRDSAGDLWGVGCDCIRKTHRKGEPIYDAAMQAKAEMDRMARHEREDRKAAAIRARLADESVRAALKAQPHPNEWRRSQGATLLDWADWMMDHAGTRGQMDVGHVIERTVAAATQKGSGDEAGKEGTDAEGQAVQ